ncbi:MAG: uracil-DNA glycosylase [Candidatus Eisenbacteria bacterium]
MRLEREIVSCRLCPRLVEHREAVAREKRRAYRDDTYWGRPVPSFGKSTSRLWIVGLAPGGHGANRTGRVFTGDASGDFLFPALHRFGFATSPSAISARDGLQLVDACITNVVRCVPPGNKPAPDEIGTCRPYFVRERALLRRLRVVLALGGLAWAEVARLLASEDPAGEPCPRFGHGVEWSVRGLSVLASYHPSQQNTRTGRLTPAMFADVLRRTRRILDDDPARPEYCAPKSRAPR